MPSNTPTFAFLGTDCTIPTTNLDLPPLENGWALDGQVVWRVVITYTDHGRNDTSPVISGSNPQWSPIPIDFQGVVQGGKIEFTIMATVRNIGTGVTEFKTLHAHNFIRGRQPSKDAIRTRLGDLVFQVIAYEESRFRQFDDTGMPLFQSQQGFGVMQPDPPSSGLQIWNWMANVDEGKKRYRDGQGTVRNHFQNTRNAHPTLPALTTEMLHLADYQFYHSGPSHDAGYYWIPNSTFDDWVPGTLTAYADHAVSVEQAVSSGAPPVDW